MTVEKSLSLEKFERLLDARQLEVSNYDGTRWYDSVRRNGATKRWKREPGKAEIPLKVGFRECFRVEFRDYRLVSGERFREKVR